MDISLDADAPIPAVSHTIPRSITLLVKWFGSNLMPRPMAAGSGHLVWNILQFSGSNISIATCPSDSSKRCKNRIHHLSSLILPETVHFDGKTRQRPGFLRGFLRIICLKSLQVGPPKKDKNPLSHPQFPSIPTSSPSSLKWNPPKNSREIPRRSDPMNSRGPDHSWSWWVSKSTKPWAPVPWRPRVDFLREAGYRETMGKPWRFFHMRTFFGAWKMSQSRTKRITDGRWIID